MNKESKLKAEDYMAYKDARTRAVLAVTNAEKAFAESKAAQAEAKYAILSLYFKYGLVPGKDEIADDGSLIYGEPAQVKVEPETKVEAKETKGKK